VLTPRVLARGRDARYLAYACGGQHRVSGWLSNRATVLVDLVDDLQRDEAVSGGACEIGVHHGRLFLLLRLLMRAGETAVAIDVFEDQHLNVDGSGLGDRAVFERNLVRWVGTMDGTRTQKADSTLIDGAQVRDWAGGGVRLFSIDGGHTASITDKDLRTASECLVDGGAVILDDVFNEAFPAVSEGLLRYLADPGHRLVPSVVVGNKTLLVDVAWSERYQQRAEQVLTRTGLYAQRHDYAGVTVLTVASRPLAEQVGFWANYTRQWAERRLPR
jgi:hypothetical protein